MLAIVVPEGEPAWEWVRGRALQKVSPKASHAVLQGALWQALDAWGAPHGRTGTEWRFYVEPVGEAPRPLVPDVAYVTFARLRPLAPSERETPPLAPDIVVEIRSRGDRDDDLADKVATYLRAGSPLVIIVDPEARTVVAHGANDERCFTASDVFVHPAAAGLRIDLAALFARLDFPE